jgi:hypothetical protein
LQEAVTVDAYNLALKGNRPGTRAVAVDELLRKA